MMMRLSHEGREIKRNFSLYIFMLRVSEKKKVKRFSIKESFHLWLVIRDKGRGRGEGKRLLAELTESSEENQFSEEF